MSLIVVIWVRFLGNWNNLPLPFLVAWVAAVAAMLASINQHLKKKEEGENDLSYPHDTSAAGSSENNGAVSGDILTLPDKIPDALHSLLSPPTDFIGREAELEELIVAVENEGAVISGPGGVGKTALALKIAEVLKPNYPDAQIYLDLKGASDQLLSRWEVLSYVIHSLQPEVKLPENEAELEKLYHVLLEGQSALLLLDNAANAEQSEALLPPKSCRLLVTSRQRFALEGLQTVDLEALTQDQAAELVEEISGAAGNSAGDSTERIAELCGCLPLALRMAAGAMACQDDLWGQDLIDALQNAQESAKSSGVETCLQVSYDHLEDDLDLQWRRLVIFPGSFDLKAAVAIWHVEADPAQEDPDELKAGYLTEYDPAQEALDELAARGMLEYDPTARRYRLHELLRKFAEEKVSPDELRQAGRQHAFYFARILEEMEQLYLEGGEKLMLGLALFDLEWENIRAGQAWAAEHLGEAIDVAQLCIDYPDYGAHCLDLRLRPLEWIEWLQAALTGARETGDQRDESGALNNLGTAFAALGNQKQAIEYHQKDLELCRETFDRRGESIALDNLGQAYAALGEPHRSIDYYEQALPILHENGDRFAESSTLSSLGNAALESGEVQRASNFYEQALQIERETGDRSGEAVDLCNLGKATLKLEEPLLAREYYEQALQVSREIGDRSGEANACWDTGLMMEDSGEYARAAELMQITIDYLRSTGRPVAEEKAAKLEEVKEKANR